jgi:hypothetical protein
LHWDQEWGPSICIRTGPGPPSAPREVHAKEVSSNSILLHWSVPERDNGLPIQEYSIRCKKWLNSHGNINSSSASASPAKNKRVDVDYPDDDFPDDIGNNLEAVYVDVDKYTSAADLQLEMADKSWGEEIYRGKIKFFLVTGLSFNTVYMFRVCAINLAGEGICSQKVSIRTLPEGSEDITPWVEAIDNASHKVYFVHLKSTSVSWKLPTGVLIDKAESFKNKKIYLHRQLLLRTAAACKLQGVKSHALKLSIKRYI